MKLKDKNGNIMEDSFPITESEKKRLESLGWREVPLNKNINGGEK